MESLTKPEKARARQQSPAREEESDHEKSESLLIVGRFGTGCKNSPGLSFCNQQGEI